jgi:glutathione peroxidase
MEENEMQVYDFSVKNNKGDIASLSEYRGKVLLIVNTATKCGLTPQYDALEALYKKYKAQGFEILDFPCNQFLSQAPGTDEEISQFCALTYGTTFPRFGKIDVNGKDADPLYIWLKEQAPEDQRDEASVAFEERVKQFTLDNAPSDIKWNFGKFLINKEGAVHARYTPTYRPEQLETEIENLLK